jgi:hypothetical protein
MRRVGVLLPAAADDPQNQIWFGAFLQGLTQSGWNIGQNVQIDTRRATASVEAVRKNAAELVALAPDVIFAVGASTVGPLVQVTRTVPIVFASVADPVGAGFVDGLARPGRNVTGFIAFEYGISGKWLEFLKQIVPSLTRIAVLRDAGTPTGIAQFDVIQAMASALRVEIIQVDLRDTGEIEHLDGTAAGLESRCRSPSARPRQAVPAGANLIRVTAKYRAIPACQAKAGVLFVKAVGASSSGRVKARSLRASSEDFQLAVFDTQSGTGLPVPFGTAIKNTGSSPLAASAAPAAA